MAAKQQALINDGIVKIEMSHILDLDFPIECNGITITLREYLISRAPDKMILRRLFLSVDKAWKGGTFNLVTTKQFHPEALRVLNYMIPECIHEYGENAGRHWFTNAGLLTYKDIKWNAQNKTTTSSLDHDSHALVEEDLFGLGSSWRSKKTILNQVNTLEPVRNENLKIKSTPPPTIGQKILDSRLNANDTHSFGSVFGRPKDDDTIATSTTTKRFKIYKIGRTAAMTRKWWP